MLSIRLFRGGKKNQPFYKIVVTDKRHAAKAGRFVEQIGFLNPLTKEKNVKEERAKYWLSVGAQPSDTIYNLFVEEGIIKGKKIALHKKKKKDDKKAEETKPEAVKPESKPEEATKEEVKEEKPEPKPEEPKEEVKSEPVKEESKPEQVEEKKEEPKEEK
tara:strand:+ start:897 stop:1376 length:480 start_codon:yes stop_codon:yes gene_type:complete